MIIIESDLNNGEIHDLEGNNMVKKKGGVKKIKPKFPRSTKTYAKKRKR